MDTTTNELRTYYERLRGTENAKNELIEDLLKRLDVLNQEHQQIKFDHAREIEYNREVQKREVLLKDELRLFRTMIVSCCGARRQTSTMTLTSYRSVTNLFLS